MPGYGGCKVFGFLKGGLEEQPAPLTAGVPVFSWKQVLPFREKESVFILMESVLLLQQLRLYLQTKCLISQNVILISQSRRVGFEQ